MPLTARGAKIKAAMRKNYGAKKGDEVFYAWQQKRKPKGVEQRDATRQRE